VSRRPGEPRQLDLFAFEPDPPPPAEPPSDEPPTEVRPDLSARFTVLNDRFFDGRLRARCEWSDRLTASAGNCATRDGVIKISAPYHRRHPESLDATLAHEMLHLIVPDHGPVFRRIGGAIARSLGISWNEFRYAKPYADTTRFRWVYACPSCRRERPSRKRRVVSCGHCGPSRFDERFRLVLVESRARPGPVLRGERPWRVESGHRE